ncbi:hypothetical protein D9619_003965 [Psilocybe cf. subviscida]|uniref:DUF7918 domain-containing protein n=1 Tax=Psilocybe cf. subviscida TaxID=2480587 RepID=A0A8H5BNP0_9AGAR|nr:hypothetical protein D9619_003965 [Psilocybe cf. subviscida]
MGELEAKGITAWIQVNEERLECYSPSGSEVGNAPLLNCWIASQAGQTFSVTLSTSRKTLPNDYVAVLKIDGHSLSDRIISRADKKDITCWNGAREGSLRRPFIFASTNVTDDDTLLDNVANPQNSRVGEIKIQIYRITGLHKVVLPNVKQYTLPPVQTVHETSVKATRPLHQISLGEGAPEINGSIIRYSYHGRHECLITFIFKYRPMETLIETGITLAPGHSVGNHYMAKLGSQRSTGGSSGSVTRPVATQPRSPHFKASSQAEVHRVKHESESNMDVQDVKPEIQTIGHLENQERYLMEQLESLRKRKRDNVQDVKTQFPGKFVKTGDGRLWRGG